MKVNKEQKEACTLLLLILEIRLFVEIGICFLFCRIKETFLNDTSSPNYIADSK